MILERYSVHISVGTQLSCPDIFCGFSSFDQTSTRIIPWLDHDRFLLNPFQFLSNHSNVCSVDIESFIR